MPIQHATLLASLGTTLAVVDKAGKPPELTLEECWREPCIVTLIAWPSRNRVSSSYTGGEHAGLSHRRDKRLEN